MHPTEKKINRLFIYWLFLSLILVFLIIIVGGLTRLTNSGLSITEWELFKGILPPLNNLSWQNYFDEYKKIPQYKILNSDMTLNEFKVIFYWEYFHRILARIIGLFFIIPLIFFYLTKQIKNEYIKICYLVFILIVLQGVLGWYMVVSGLTNDITVSHYRLSIHLVNAILIISTLFWLIKNFVSKKNKIFFNISFENLPFQILILLIFFQVIMGAFVSGLDAGKIYQTWPLMGNRYLPNDFNFENFTSIFEFNNHSLVQFYHRNLAYLIIIYVSVLTIIIFKRKISNLYKPLKILLFFLLLQVILGIYTLISGLNIYLASMHQITSVLLIFSALNLYFLRVK
jgi:cytochrome c oxidase assembly protein subunit 15